MITITTSDGICHVLESAAAIADYTSSLNTRSVLEAACAAGHSAPHIPPAPEPVIPPPNWIGFRLALSQSKSFRLWSEMLPDSWREDLKIAAAVENVSALQSTFNHCKTLAIPVSTAVTEWQQAAAKNHIPITF